MFDIIGEGDLLSWSSNSSDLEVDGLNSSFFTKDLINLLQIIEVNHQS